MSRRRFTGSFGCSYADMEREESRIAQAQPLRH